MTMNALRSIASSAGLAIGLMLGTTPWVRAADAAPDSAAFPRGAKTWANNCVRCHNARDPKDFRDDQWRVIMSHMRIRASLTGQETRDVLGFLQQSSRHAPAPLAQVPTAAAGSATAGLSGKALFESACIACHGADGTGTIPGVPDLTEPGGRLAQPDAVLLGHVRDGIQTPGSSMAMPPKGGNPNLTDQDIARLVDYMKASLKP
jgi:cytochrome c5